MNERAKQQTKAVIYIRVAHGNAEQLARRIELQREQCLGIANRLECVVAAEYVEVGPGSTLEGRPQIQHLLDRIAEGDIRYLIATDFARLSRLLDQHAILHRRLKLTNTSFVTRDSSGDIGELEVQILYGIALAATNPVRDEEAERG
jgi:Resolvase, N terminal domain.